MISKKNYFNKLKSFNKKDLPQSLKDKYDFTEEATENHTTWEYYNSDDSIRETIDQYFAELNEFLEAGNKKSNNTNDKENELKAWNAAVELIHSYVLRGDTYEELNTSQLGRYSDDYYAAIKKGKIEVNEINGKEVKYTFPLKGVIAAIQDQLEKSAPKKAKQKQPATEQPKEKIKSFRTDSRVGTPVEKFNEAVYFLRRYMLCHGKMKNQKQILGFIGSLQKAIVEKRIRKTNTYASQIEYIQSNLIKLHKTMKQKKQQQVEFVVSKKIYDEFAEIANSERIRLSVTYIKRYIGMQGKEIDKVKAEKLHHLIEKAFEKKRILASDPYSDRLKNILSALENFIDEADEDATLKIHSEALSGISGALEGCCCNDCEPDKELSGFSVDEPKKPENMIMNSMDFNRLNFATIGFTGKWLELIGDPSEGFSAMVFGKPKMGKSYLCVDFAGYLARNHGRVLYIAREEKLDYTLQKKLRDKQVEHPLLDVSDFLPTDLSRYQFVFLDSLNRLGLTPSDVINLRERYPKTAFIEVFQTTKTGKFRGENTHQHDVDIIIEVPEKGKAVQFGRYNQGGEVEIFA